VDTIIFKLSHLTPESSNKNLSAIKNEMILPQKTGEQVKQHFSVRNLEFYFGESNQPTVIWSV